MVPGFRQDNKMAAIQDSPYPLVFPVANLPPAFMSPAANLDAQQLSIRTTARALTGMQKEAVVVNRATGTCWRMVCDEGPYLHGSDLAPFPLAFFCTGMVSSYMSSLLQLLRQHGISHRNISLLLHNRYSMEGSARAGTMTGSALPVELQLVIDSPVKASVLQQLLKEAVAASPAAALLSGTYISEFSLTHNGEQLETARVAPTNQPLPLPPAGFAELSPVPAARFAADIIRKHKTAAIVEGVTGGVGTSLAENQKRVLHITGACTLRADGLKQLGSQFHFLSDDSAEVDGQERAPCGLAYLSAGLAFCYMTQIGRYATIMRRPLDAFRIVQDTCFEHPAAGKPAGMQPVVTHVFIDSKHSDEYARQVVDMSEQTCFLHAACRAVVPVELQELCRAIPIIP
jgi:uncharacterized OsmC-like protein